MRSSRKCKEEGKVLYSSLEIPKSLLYDRHFILIFHGLILIQQHPVLLLKLDVKKAFDTNITCVQ